MLKIKTKELELILGFKVKPYFTSLGIDTASRSGFCKIHTTDKESVFDFGYIDVKGKDWYFKFDRMIEMFEDLLSNIDKSDSTVIIEDVFYSKNAHVLRTLSRIGMICYTLAKKLGLDRKFIMAVKARTALGFPGNIKKQELHKIINRRFGFNIADEDIVDAIVLALIGIIEPKEEATLFKED